MKKYFVFGLLLVFCFNIVAQNNLSGSITDTQKLPVQGASVRVYEPRTKQLLSFAISNPKGIYRISKPIEIDSVRLVVSMMGYKSQERIITKQDLNQNFVLTSQAIELQEVKVETPPIRRSQDTLRYDIKKFANATDRNLGDALKKLPGIEVEQNGTIKYNGEAINKYYTEGKDLFQGNYKVANDNFRWQDVERIEVMENHQPVRMLNNIQHSDKAGLNVVFKEDSKAKWIRKLDAGVGKSTTDYLYENTLSLVRISKKNQTFSVLTNNNTGADLSLYTQILTPEMFFETGPRTILSKNTSPLTSIVGLSTPALNQRFFLDNQSHYGTSKNLWTVRKIYETVLNIDFLRDQRLNQGSSEMRYFLGKDTLRVRENQDNRYLKSQIEGSLSIVANQPKYYFSNKLLIKSIWNDVEGNILNQSNENRQTVLQQNGFDTKWISDELKILKRNSANNILELKMFGYYLDSPQSLNVALERISQPIFQDVRIQKSFINLYTNFVLNKKLKVNIKTGVDYSNQNLKSELRGFPSAKLIGDSSLLIRNQNLSYWRLFAETGYSIITERLKLNLNLPINFLFWQNIGRKRIYAEPRLSVSYLFNAKWTTNISYQYSYQIPEINDFNKAFVLMNYRNISRNDGQLPENQVHSGNVSINFKDAVSFWFFNIRGGINEIKNNILPVQAIDGIYLSQVRTFGENVNFNKNLSADVSKYIYEIKTKFTFGASVQNQQSIRLVSDNQLATIDNTSNNISFGINAKALEWLQTQFDINVINSTNTVKTNLTNSNSNYKATTFRVQTDLILSKQLTCGFEANKYQIESSGIQPQNYLFLDFSSTYRFKKSGFELNLYTRNLTNENAFQSISFADNSASTTNFMLRPRQILLKFGIKF
jgi:hypothetical protein